MFGMNFLLLSATSVTERGGDGAGDLVALKGDFGGYETHTSLDAASCRSKRINQT